MQRYAILHNPTGQLFPYIGKGSSWFYFTAKASYTSPRFFSTHWRAKAYLKNYLKGPIGYGEDGILRYYKPSVPRNPEDFQIVIVNLEISNV